MTAQVRLKNVSGGVRGFFGAQSISKDGKVPGLRINPNETKVLLTEQVAALKNEALPHFKMLQHFLSNGDLLDLDDAFTAAVVDAPSEAGEDPTFMQEDEVITNEEKAAAYVALTEEKALAAVVDEADLQVLELWYKAETRTSVKDQINKRGQYIVANANKKSKG